MKKNSEEVLILDVIPLNVGEMYPNKNKIIHYKVENVTESNIDSTKDCMIRALKLRFIEYDTIIILEKGRVIGIK